jgi:16S rRNA (cytosine967-C5)-methyltransferase
LGSQLVTTERGRQGSARRLPQGFQARKLAVALVAAVLRHGRAFDDAAAFLQEQDEFKALEPRDRGLARLIAATVLRRQGQIDAVLATFLERPLPEKRGDLSSVLQAAVAQLLFLESAPHAVLNIAVEQCRSDSQTERFAKLTNAVLRRVAEQGAGIVAAQDAVRLDIPDWMWRRWVATYGEETTRGIAAASLAQAPLDISVKSDAAGWATRLGAEILPTGSLRRAAEGRVEDLPGYAEGGWWVQDAAAALPSRLLGDVRGKRVADLCAAPGGKTAALASRGARVTAIDLSAERLQRVRHNLDRLQLKAELVEADVMTWQPAEAFDAVLLDVPCSATGTIRRHPDILRLKRPADIAKLAPLQYRMLENALRMVVVGGLVVFCTCSLEPEEGVAQVTRLLKANRNVKRRPILALEVGGEADWISREGDLRTLPFHLPRSKPELSGMDGFFAARLVRKA